VTVLLTGDDLTLDELLRVARARERVEVAAAAWKQVEAGRRVVEEALARGLPVYGLTTGVGVRKRVLVPPEGLAELNRRLIGEHRVGQGPYAPEEAVRAALLRLANGLVKGTAGVRPELVQLVVAALNERRRPAVRMLGSIGEGDLAPMADLAHGILGDFALAPGEGLALLNNNAFSTGLAAVAVADTVRLADLLDVAAALDLEAFAANPGLLHPALAASRPYPGLQAARARLHALLEGSYLWEPGAARNLQDPLTFRCLPQVHGALRDSLDYVCRQLAVELNAAQGNPLVVPAEGTIVSVGNFDVLPLAAALDFLRLALAPALTSACERLLKLLQAPLSGLPEGLAARPGLAHDSLSELGIAAQALAAEARLLAQPVSSEVVSSTQAEGIEDRMTMAPLAARRLAEMVALGERLVAIELVVACQATDLRSGTRLGRGTRRVYELVRSVVPFTGEGDSPPQDLEPLLALLRAEGV
jgi:histidine ammonia-lyase